MLAAAISLDGGQFLVAGMMGNGPAHECGKEAIKAAISSFHRIGLAGRRPARPCVISVTEAKVGTSMAGLAEHSPFGLHAKTYFRLMNNLDPGGAPRPGQLLKVVN